MPAKRAVAYTRYSSDNQREESIDAQLRAIQEHCVRKGYTFVRNYADEARSATTDNRPKFLKMIGDSANGEFDLVIVHKLDRFARERYDSAFYKRTLKKNGVRLESVLEQLDDSPESIILESVLEGMAEYYSKNLAREARKGMLENALKAIHAGGRPPYGYRVNLTTRKLEIDEHAAAAVRYYFQAVDEGRSVAEIARTLNEKGYLSQRGSPFTINSFQGWSKNRKYIGTYTWDVRSAKDESGKRRENAHKDPESQIVIPNAVPPLISEALFLRVNEKLLKRQKGPGAMKATQVYLLTSKVFCGKCNATYHGESYRNAKSQQRTLLSFYKCADRCGNVNVRKEDLEKLVVQHLIESVFSDQAIEELAEKACQLYLAQKQQGVEEILPIQKELGTIKKKLQNWVNAIGDGLLDKEDAAELIEQVKSRREVLESELQRIQILHSSSQIDDAVIKQFLHKQKNTLLSIDMEEKKRVIQELVESVTVLPSDNIDKYDVDVTYRCFNGGGEGNRTPVRRSRHNHIYGCSR